MTDKQIFVKDINVPRKEQIIIDGVDVSECEFYVHYDYGKFPHGCSLHKDMFGLPACCDVADCCKNCYFKQLQKEKFENLNNRQMVESAENLIYENSELIKNLEEKKQECEKYEQALDSIYQYIKTCICEYCISKKDECVGCYHQDFLDIINKAKDTTNET